MPRAVTSILKALGLGYSKRVLFSAPRCCQVSSSTRSISTSRVMASREIKVSEEEATLFATLVAAAKFSELNVTLRVAGGWVRDKLLGKESDDIDIALDSLMGREFAEKVNLYLQSKDEEAAKVAVIQANPEQSKHLETARLKIKDTWIDLVNLRSETYSQDSRVPTMEFGTPLEDAERRDFTVNSMFYNINEGIIEDFTGKGIPDLDEGVIRTPLTPMETFLDDPLRVLRAVRFGARFGFRLDDALQEAASSEKVVKALQQKVSKERVGAELEGMLKCKLQCGGSNLYWRNLSVGGDPVGAITHLVNLSLFTTVFSLPGSVALRPEYAQNCLSVMEGGWRMLSDRGPELGITNEERRLFLLSSLLLPLRKSTYMMKKKQTPATLHVIREELKFKAKDAEAIALLHDSLPAVLKAMLILRDQGYPPAGGNCTPDPEVNVRVALGLWVRELKEIWRLGVLLAPLLSIPEAKPLVLEATEVDSMPGMQLLSSNDKEDVWNKRHSFSDELCNTIHGYGLSEAWRMKPLMDGKSMMTALGMTRGGPKLGVAMKEATLWQLANPTGSKEELEEYIKGKLSSDG